MPSIDSAFFGSKRNGQGLGYCRKGKAMRDINDPEALEAMVDRNNLGDVLQGLAEICYGKGAHIRETWQDPTLAGLWNKAGRAIERLADSKTIRQIP